MSLSFVWRVGCGINAYTPLRAALDAIAGVPHCVVRANAWRRCAEITGVTCTEGVGKEHPVHLALCNHVGWADFYLDALIVDPERAIYLGRTAVMTLPLVSTVYAVDGIICFRRGAGQRSALYDKIKQYVSNGRVPVIFPEGTRNRGRERVPLKIGVIKMAYECEIPIVIYASDRKEEVIDETAMRVSDGPVRVSTRTSGLIRKSEGETLDAFVRKVQREWDSLAGYDTSPSATSTQTDTSTETQTETPTSTPTGRTRPWVWNVPMAVYIGLVHVAAAWGMCCVGQVSRHTLAWAAALYFFGNLGITGGSHRLWSHRSYTAHATVRLFLMLCASIANQGSIYHWVRDHRVHHKYSETDADPHNAARGFWFSHVGWLLFKKHPKVIEAGKKLDFSDLEQDGLVMFQKRFDPWFSMCMCFLMPAWVAQVGWGEAFWPALAVAGMLRYVASLHATWFVNSAAHLWGARPYDPDSGPAENLSVSVLAIGEGWHNWHHKYPYDYAASEFGVHRQFNPTKLFIDALAQVGLVTKRKRATGAWARLKGD